MSLSIQPQPCSQEPHDGGHIVAGGEPQQPLKESYLILRGVFRLPYSHQTPRHSIYCYSATEL